MSLNSILFKAAQRRKGAWSKVPPVINVIVNWSRDTAMLEFMDAVDQRREAGVTPEQFALEVEELRNRLLTQVGDIMVESFATELERDPEKALRALSKLLQALADATTKGPK